MFVKKYFLDTNLPETLLITGIYNTFSRGKVRWDYGSFFPVSLLLSVRKLRAAGWPGLGLFQAFWAT